MTDRPLPVEVEDLTAEWFASALELDVRAATVVDRHTGTTGRVRVALEGGDGVPANVFVKLAPFDAAQRTFVNQVGMGVAEARFYRDLAHEVDVRVPRPWFADQNGEDRYVMVLEDLESSGCRFPKHDDADIEHRTRDIVEQLARLHAPFWESDRFEPDGDLEWLVSRSSGTGDGGTKFIRMAVDTYADRLPDGFLPLAELYVERSREIAPLYRTGERTLAHGDAHLGNLFVDGSRTGFLDWAMVGRAPGMRDVAYVMCNSIPTELRRSNERALVARYCELLGDAGIALAFDEAWEQYRLFCLTAWVAATATVGMGSKWQPEHIGLGGTVRATLAANDLGTLDLLEELLARR